MRNCRAIGFLFALCGGASASSAQVFEWPLGGGFGINEGSYVWYFTNPYIDDLECDYDGVGIRAPRYCGYHAGEDWSGTDDCGEPIASPYDGEVVYETDFSGSYAIVVKYPLLEGNIYMTFHHCQDDPDSRWPMGPIDQGDTICKVGKTGTGSCHMHWELNHYEGEFGLNFSLSNPWLEGTRCSLLDEARQNCIGDDSDRKRLTFKNGLATYGTPSLFLSDRGHEAVSVRLVDGDWSESFTVSGFSPNSLAYLKESTGTGTSLVPLSQAYEDALVVDIEYMDETGSWVRWQFHSSLSFFSQETIYRIRAGTLPEGSWHLIIPVPSHEQRDARARMEMIQLANLDACSASRNNSCFSLVENRTFKKRSSPFAGSDIWDMWSMKAKIIDSEGASQSRDLLYASHRENPLLRCVRRVEPSSGARDELWSPVAPGRVYSTPSVTLDFAQQTFANSDNCNEQLAE